MANSAIKEIKYLRKLLQQEKEAHKRQFNAVILRSSPKHRQTLGLSWYPLEVRKMGYGLGNQPFVEVERRKNRDMPHQFQAGKIVKLFAQQLGFEDQQVKGIVNFIAGNRMKITLYTEQLPDWVRNGRLGVDLFFDDRSFSEMEKALQVVLQAEKGRVAELREILLGYQPAKVMNDDRDFYTHHLNFSQNQAVNQILHSKDVTVIHGPPGTGKTTTLIHAVSALVSHNERLLVCAPSNAATDLLTEKIAEQGLTVVRIGNLSRVDESLVRHTIEGHLSQMPEYENIIQMKRKASELRKLAKKHRQNTTYEQREQNRQWRREASSLRDQAGMFEQFLIDQILKQANVITTTLVSAAHRYLETQYFDTVLIDEAAQALEPATWIPIIKAQKVVFAGDPFQLPPTILSPKAQQKGLAITLLEKCLLRQPRVYLLDTQYRMNEVIMGFSNEQFYGRKLKAHKSVQQQVLAFKEASVLVDGAIINQAVKDEIPLEFIDTAGCEYYETLNQQTQSYYNPNEYFLLGQHLDLLLAQCSPDAMPNVGIIAPYKEQVEYIAAALKEHDNLWTSTKIDVNTIDAFQGQERDVIYISLVRSNQKKKIGFLRDIRRMNVAITRAKKKLIVIGDSETLRHDDFYRNFIHYCDKHGQYVLQAKR